jgi:hypothetical protein
MKNMTVSISVAVVALVSAAAPHRAVARPGQPGQPALTSPPPAAKEPPRTKTVYYGLQIFFADAVLAAFALGSQRAEPAIGLLLTGAVIHGVHGRADAAVGSLLLRTTVPLLGLMVGFESCEERPVDDELGCLDNGMIGFGLGLALTVGVDYFALARKTVSDKARVRPAVTMSPTAGSAGVQVAF